MIRFLCHLERSGFGDPVRPAEPSRGAGFCSYVAIPKQAPRSESRDLSSCADFAANLSKAFLLCFVSFASRHGFNRADTSPKLPAALAAEGANSAHLIEARLLGGRSVSSDINSLREAPSARGDFSASIPIQGASVASTL